MEESPKILRTDLSFQTLIESYNKFFEFYRRAADGDRPLLRLLFLTRSNSTARWSCNRVWCMTTSLIVAPLPIPTLCCIITLIRGGGA